MIDVGRERPDISAVCGEALLENRLCRQRVRERCAGSRTRKFRGAAGGDQQKQPEGREPESEAEAIEHVRECPADRDSQPLEA